ncbi:hypothetical protein FJ970_25210 [Mesorhizobium sp. B2-1-8]|uniref:hypothetical protein n=1 Tax=Mesorhizobium sp. B2-1-8 TaxID=2589967 RepID=UPI0015E303D6|nr:hypothetical protein [Mesorhizobium sp. B2-1-8]UCI18353.1 hypothetical protein FJ970_25210 [Mesorhizobium sp. B2-1-8]
MRLEKIRQRGRYRLPARIFLADGVNAELRAFGRVNAVQPNSLPGNFDGVAVDDKGTQRRGRGKQRKEK